MPNITYIEYSFAIDPIQPGAEILMAELGETGFESFVENENSLYAYIKKEEWNVNVVEEIQILSNPEFNIEYTFREIEQENWNKVWESNFDPIHVNGRCTVRAPFHKKSKARFDIVIEPKMSFGTGHHETTHMMLRHILDTDFRDKTVLDMGSGTGVLAILSAMKGAQSIEAIDIDPWCFQNAQENIKRNRCEHIEVHQGDSKLLDGKKFDIVLANINRNILLDDIPVYAECLNKMGQLFLSGFYEKDLPKINEKCAEKALKFEKKFEKNNWVAVKYVF